MGMKYLLGAIGNYTTEIDLLTKQIVRHALTSCINRKAMRQEQVSPAPALPASASTSLPAQC